MKSLLIIAAAFLLSNLAQAQSCPEPDDTHRYVETVLHKAAGTGNIRVYYKTPYGFDADKPTMLIINGGPGGDHRIVDSFSEIKDQYNLVGFDHRGLGCTKITSRHDSSYRPYMYETERAAHDIDAIRRDLLGEDGKWFVYGVSYGGMLGQQYAFHYQEHISGLILDSTFHDSSAIDVGRRSYFRLFIQDDPSVGEMYNQIVNRYPDARDSLLRVIWSYTYSYRGRKVMIPRLFEAILSQSDPLLAKQLYFQKLSNRPAWGMGAGIICEEIWDHSPEPSYNKYYFAQFPKFCTNYDTGIRKPMKWADNLKELKVKTLILAGGYDPVTPGPVMKIMDRLAPNSYLYNNDHAGHGLYFEKGECVRKLFTAFTTSEDAAIDATKLAEIGDSEECQSAPLDLEETPFIEWKDRIGVDHNGL